MSPAKSSLFWVKFGGFGRQLAILSEPVLREGKFRRIGYKWRNQSQEWTGRVVVHPADIIGSVTKIEMDSLLVKRAEEAAKEQLALFRELGIK